MADNLNSTSSNGLLNSLGGMTRSTPNIVPQRVNPSGGGLLNNNVNSTSLANVNLQRQQTNTNQVDTRLMSSLNINIDKLSMKFDESIKTQTTELKNSLGDIRKSITEGFESVTNLMSQLFQDRTALLQEQMAIQEKLSEHEQYFNGFISTFISKKFKSLTDSVNLISLKDVKETIVRFTTQNDKIAKFLELTPLSYLKPTAKLAPFTEELSDAIKSSAKSMAEVSAYIQSQYKLNQEILDKVTKPQMKIMVNYLKQNNMLIKHASDSTKYLASIYQMLHYNFKEKPEKELRQEQTKLRNAQSSLNTIEYKRTHGQTLSPSDRKNAQKYQTQINESQKKIRDIRSDQSKIFDTKIKLDKKPNYNVKEFSKLSGTIDNLVQQLRQNVISVDNNTSEIQKAVSASDIFKKIGLSLLNPMTWGKLIFGSPITKLMKYMFYYNIAKTGIDWGRKGLNYVKGIELPVKRENGTPYTVGSILGSGYNAVKKYAIDPLLSGIKSIFKWMLGEEWFTKVSSTLTTIKDSISTVWDAMFGSEIEQANGRKKIGEFLSEYIQKGVAVLTKTLLQVASLYTGIKALQNPDKLKDAFSKVGLTKVVEKTRGLIGLNQDQRIIRDAQLQGMAKMAHDEYGTLHNVQIKDGKVLVEVPKEASRFRSVNFLREKFGFNTTMKEYAPNRDGEYYKKYATYDNQGKMVAPEENFGKKAYYKSKGFDINDPNIHQNDRAVLDANFEQQRNSIKPNLMQRAWTGAKNLPFIGKGFGVLGSVFRGLGAFASGLQAVLGPIFLVVSAFKVVAMVINGITSIYDKFAGKSKDPTSSIIGGVGNMVGSWLGSFFKTTGSVIKKVVLGIPSIMLGVTKGVWGFIVSEGPKLIKSSFKFLIVDLPIAFLKVITWPFKWIWNTFKRWWDDKDKAEKEAKKNIRKKLGASADETGWLKGMAVSFANGIADVVGAQRPYQLTDDDKVYNLVRKSVYTDLSQHNNVEELIKSGYIAHLDKVAQYTEEAGLQDGFTRLSETLKGITETYQKDKTKGANQFKEFLAQIREIKDDQILFTEDFQNHMDTVYKGLSRSIERQNLTSDQIKNLYMEKIRDQMNVIDPEYLKNKNKSQDKLPKPENPSQQEDNNYNGASIGALAQYFQSGKFQKFIKDSITALGDKIKAGWEFLKNQDYKKMFSSAMEVFGGVSGSIMNTLFGQEKANQWIDSAMAYADSHGYTYAKSFLKGAKNSLLDYAKQIAENTGKLVEQTSGGGSSGSGNGVSLPGGGGASLGGIIGQSELAKSNITGSPSNLIPEENSSAKIVMSNSHRVNANKVFNILSNGKSLYDSNGNVNINEDNAMLGFASTYTREGGVAINKREILPGTKLKKGVNDFFWSKAGIYAAYLPKYVNGNGGKSAESLGISSEIVAKVRSIVGNSDQVITNFNDPKLQQLNNEILANPKYKNDWIKLAYKVYKNNYYTHYKDWPYPTNVLLADRQYQAGAKTFDIAYAAEKLGYQPSNKIIKKLKSSKGRYLYTVYPEVTQFVLNKAKEDPYGVGELLLTGRLLTPDWKGTTYRNHGDVIAKVYGYSRKGVEYFHKKSKKHYTVAKSSTNTSGKQEVLPAASQVNATQDTVQSPSALADKPASEPVKSQTPVANKPTSEPVKPQAPVANKPTSEPAKPQTPTPNSPSTQSSQNSDLLDNEHITFSGKLNANNQYELSSTFDKPDISLLDVSNDSDWDNIIDISTIKNLGETMGFKGEALFKFMKDQYLSTSTSLNRRAKASALDNIENLYNSDKLMTSIIPGSKFIQGSKSPYKYASVVKKLQARKLTAQKAKEFLTSKELTDAQKGDLKEYINILTQLLGIVVQDHGKSDDRAIQLTNVINQLSKRQETVVQNRPSGLHNLGKRLAKEAKKNSLSKAS